MQLKKPRTQVKLNFSQSIEMIDKAILSDPSDPHLQYYRGELGVYTSDWKRAEHFFANAIRLFPKFVKAQAALEMVREKIA